MAPRPPVPSSVLEQENAFAPFLGKSTIGGLFSTENLDPLEILNQRGRKKLKKAGLDPKEDRISLTQLQDLGLDAASDFQKPFRKALRVEGLLGEGKKGPLATSEILNQFVGDVEPGTVESALQEGRQAILEQISGGVDLQRQGIDLASGNIDDPLAASVLASINEQFGANLGAAGFSGVDSGQAAFNQTLLGRAALQGLGQDLFNFGATVQGRADPFSSPAFNIGRDDLNFNRRNFNFLFDTQQRQIESAADDANLFRQVDDISKGLFAPDIFGFIPGF